MCLWPLQEDLRELGRLLRHGAFSVWTVHKERSKVKGFIRFKPSQRQLYLFERGIVFCKIRMEPSDQGMTPHYSFKKSVKVKGTCCPWGSTHPVERNSDLMLQTGNCSIERWGSLAKCHTTEPESTPTSHSSIGAGNQSGDRAELE